MPAGVEARLSIRKCREHRGLTDATRYVHTMSNVVHHIELWTSAGFGAGLRLASRTPRLGRGAGPGWPQGRIWHHASGGYLVLEQSPDATGPHERTHAGRNHLALRVDSTTQLDKLRRECPGHGWRELYADRYPHAGGPDQTALFIENGEGFELELVAE